MHIALIKFLRSSIKVSSKVKMQIFPDSEDSNQLIKNNVTSVYRDDYDYVTSSISSLFEFLIFARTLATLKLLKSF